MDWKQLLGYISGSVEEDLLPRIEYGEHADAGDSDLLTTPYMTLEITSTRS